MWEPIELPTDPIPRSEAANDDSCGWCGAEPGEPCRSIECGTWDYDDALEDEYGCAL